MLIILRNQFFFLRNHEIPRIHFLYNLQRTSKHQRLLFPGAVPGCLLRGGGMSRCWATCAISSEKGRPAGGGRRGDGGLQHIILSGLKKVVAKFSLWGGVYTISSSTYMTDDEGKKGAVLLFCNVTPALAPCSLRALNGSTKILSV